MPSALDLMIEVLDDVKAHPKDRFWAMAGAGVVLAPAMVFVTLALVGYSIAVVAASILADQNIGLYLLGLVGGSAAFLLTLSVGVGILVAPIQASLGRAVLRSMEDGSDLGTWAAYESATDDFASVMGVVGFVTVLATLGLFFLYVPTLLVLWGFGLALPGVLVHRLGALAALRRAWEHAVGQPVWHLSLAGVSWGLMMLFANLPVIGYPIGIYLSTAVQVRAYVAVFGRAEAPT